MRLGQMTPLCQRRPAAICQMHLPTEAQNESLSPSCRQRGKPPLRGFGDWWQAWPTHGSVGGCAQTSFPNGLIS